MERAGGGAGGEPDAFLQCWHLVQQESTAVQLQQYYYLIDTKYQVPGTRYVALLFLCFSRRLLYS